jgi:hypothetical protein
MAVKERVECLEAIGAMGGLLNVDEGEKKGRSS